uniref:Uncharacterized protein n=1 Tax=Trichuris muris TaxID=70415 RepID=A0A5S6Q4Z0_TRIMR
MHLATELIEKGSGPNRLDLSPPPGAAFEPADQVLLFDDFPHRQDASPAERTSCKLHAALPMHVRASKESKKPLESKSPTDSLTSALRSTSGGMSSFPSAIGYAS